MDLLSCLVEVRQQRLDGAELRKGFEDFAAEDFGVEVLAGRVEHGRQEVPDYRRIIAG